VLSVQFRSIGARPVDGFHDLDDDDVFHVLNDDVFHVLDDDDVFHVLDDDDVFYVLFDLVFICVFIVGRCPSQLC
jgi:hypothetical protein